MTRSNLVKLVREVLQELDEANVTGGTATFTPGTGAQYATPHAFGKGKRAKKTLTKIGWKQQKRPKRPSNTKMFDYL
jgi:hypothetical protein|tara:strand:+ start:1630 stop:1860 length:231 start_codon:yes stop_codon:yes gene_type:complete